MGYISHAALRAQQTTMQTTMTTNNVIRIRVVTPKTTLRLAVPQAVTFKGLAAMVRERVSPKSEVVSFTTEGGDCLSNLDLVADLLEKDETIIAVEAAPTLVPCIGAVHVGMVAPAVEDQAPVGTCTVELPTPKPKAATKVKRKAGRNHCVTVDVPNAAIGAVVGHKGSNVTAVEHEHGAKVQLDGKTGVCTIKAHTAAAANAAAADVQRAVSGVMKRTKSKQRAESRQAVNQARKMPLDQAKEVLACDRRIKALKAKLHKIESTKARVASNDTWIEVNELKQLEMEVQYREELAQVWARNLPRDPSTLKELKFRVAREEQQQ